MCVGFLCRFQPILNYLILFINSACCEILARYRWPLHVRLPSFPHVQFNLPVQLGVHHYP
jgi:hypothetical protein